MPGAYEGSAAYRSSSRVSYPAVMPGAPYYAEAFSPLPGRCFRLATQDGQGGPMHCPQPLVWRCTFRARDGRRYLVEACEGHRPPVVSPQPARAASTARREAGG
jgi:hypothetical protein